MDLRTGAMEHPSGGVVQKSAFARFLASFDFRLIQQYPPFAVIQNPIFSDLTIEIQKATRALHRMAFARLSPWALQRFRLEAHSVQPELPV